VGKPELVAAAAEAADLSLAQAKKAVDAVFDSIASALKKGEKVQIVGFGSFEVRKRKARKAINPRTREVINVAATKAPAFKAGAQLKAVVAGKK
jgi:DNA-binding protein HU-beta